MIENTPVNPLCETCGKLIADSADAQKLIDRQGDRQYERWHAERFCACHSRAPMVQPVVDYLVTERIQIKFQHPRGATETFTQLELLLPSGNLRTLKVHRKFLDRRTPDQIRSYCQETNIAKQLEEKPFGESIEIIEMVE